MGRRQTITRYVLEGTAVLLLALLGSLVIALHVTRPPIGYEQETALIGSTVQAQVEEVLDEAHAQDAEGLFTVQQELKLRILSPGPYQGRMITVEYNGMGPALNAVRFREGSRALVMVSELPADAVAGATINESSTGARTVYQVADHVRLIPLGLITLAFAAVTVLVGRWQGVRALLGLALSGLLIGSFVLPQILAHRDPILVSTVGAGLLLAATLYLIQGWNAASHTALIGVLVSLAATSALAIALTRFAYLTGFGTEETLFLQASGVALPMRGLLLAGMILGTAGVLDDVVIAQAVTVFELSAADASRRPRELYVSGMRVGVTHLASMVNTLVLAYASTSLPLLILFYLFPEPAHLTINRELIAEEIVRSLVGSIGLMLAVPLTTLIAAEVAPLLQDVTEPTPDLQSG
jgi:uncharacterized membrane protein